MPQRTHVSKTPPSTHPPGSVTRRKFLQAAAPTSLLAASTAGCSLLSTEPTSPNRGGDQHNRRGKEAPQLAEDVRAGTLPALRKRLPDKPLVIKPTDRSGTYGGAWKTAILGPAESGYLNFTVGYDPILRWTVRWTGAAGTDEIVPNVAEDFQMNDDGSVYTFRLRDGMRWSDGKPLTTDDVLFAVDDAWLNTDINPIPPQLLRTGDHAAKVEKVDRSTFKIIFPKPSGLFLQRAATRDGQMLTMPSHYLKQFHKKYNSAASKDAKDEGFESWMDLFSAKADPWHNPDLPTLNAWKATTELGKGTRFVTERNPYYWKTDSAGRQLPYLDRAIFQIITQEEVLLLKAQSGDLNLELGPDTRFTSAQNKPVLARSRKKGGYRFVDVQPTRMNVMSIMLNLTHKDPVKREIFTNKDFRVGLSYAINRKEIVNSTLQRQGEPYQMAPVPESPFYDKEFATQYLAYDPAKAKSHLDKAGYTETNSSGIRLGPDGLPISFIVEFVPEFRSEWSDMLTLVRTYWREVGIDIHLKSEDRSLWNERAAANEHDACVWTGGGGLAVILRPSFYFPQSSLSYFATPWGSWYSSRGNEGEKPPAAPKRQMELYDRLTATADPAEQTMLMHEIIGISKEQFYGIGVARETDKYFIASTKFENITEPMIMDADYATPGPTRPEQYFLKR